MKPLQPTPASIGQVIRAQQKANACLLRAYYLADSKGGLKSSKNKRRRFRHFAQVWRLQDKWGLKIGLVNYDTEPFHEPEYGA